MGRDYKDPGLNEVELTGNLTRDPELVRFDSGSAVCKFSIACNRRFKRKDSDEWEEETSFFDVENFGKGAESLSGRLRKGEPVLVRGRLSVDSWEQEGVKRSKVYVTAYRVHQMSWPDDGAGKPKLSGAGVAEKEDDMPF